MLALISAVLLLHTLSADGEAPSPSAPGAQAAIIRRPSRMCNSARPPCTVHRGRHHRLATKDLFPHTVTAQGKAFDSHDIAPDASWNYHAVKAGVFTYTCTYHPTMKGQLSVQ